MEPSGNVPTKAVNVTNTGPGPRYASVSIYPNIVTAPFISHSPVKQQIIPGAQTSPRPIILFRKRVAGDSSFASSATTSPSSSQQNQLQASTVHTQQSSSHPVFPGHLPNLYISHGNSGATSINKTASSTLTCASVITSSSISSACSSSLSSTINSSSLSPGATVSRSSGTMLSSTTLTPSIPSSVTLLPSVTNASVIHHSQSYNDISSLATTPVKDRTDLSTVTINSLSIGGDRTLPDNITSNSGFNTGQPNSIVISSTSRQNQQSTPNSDASGATPRKKPRKQQLEPFQLTTSRNIKLLSSNHDFRNDPDDRDGMNLSPSSSHSNNNNNFFSSYFKDNNSSSGAAGSAASVTNTSSVHKKPRPSILTSYNIPWKSLQYHFLRYSDVKQKPEKKLTLSELSNEGIQKKNGWKVQHLVTHIEDTEEREAEVLQQIILILRYNFMTS
ncbi:uncharacterized protein LOC141855975 isoform X2 [Brevipalpus obovatus]|uniref:uncharacterized protein LOC141855975 isoform X2 n=1 Tax=Brevipalpus obovatus TaxID=246614 RepID=UPI003D9DE18E